MCVREKERETLYLYTKPHYTTPHYTTLHYTTLHCTTLHYTTLHYTSFNAKFDELLTMKERTVEQIEIKRFVCA
jgi:hypothetical protein